jgi:hypothetical protein
MGRRDGWVILALCAVAAGLAAMPAGAGAAAPANLFTNPSFELGQDGWRMDKGKGTEARFAVDQAMAADGQSSAVVTIEKVGEWGTQFGQSFDAGAKGKTCTFAVFARSAEGAVQVQLEIERRADSYDRAVRSEKFALAPDKWTELHVTFRVEKDCPEGWFAYVSCMQAGVRYRADMFRLYEGQFVPWKEAAGEEAAAAVRVYDTGTRLAGPPTAEALARREGWKELAEGGAPLALQGDAVLANSTLALVLRRGGPGAELYGAGPKGFARRAVLGPAAEGAVRIEAVKVTENGPGGAAVEVRFDVAKGSPATLAYALKTGQTFVETSPRAGATGLAVEAPCRFAVLPDFFADDIVLDATDLAADVAELPADNFVLHLVDDGGALVMAVWNGRDADARAALGGAGADRRIEQTAVAYGKDGKVWVAVLEGEGIWHRRDVARGDAGQVVRLDWTAPYPAQWRVDWRRADGLADSWEMAVEKPDGRFAKFGMFGGEDTLAPDRKRWTTVLGSFRYPCWIDKGGRGCLQPLKEGLAFEGPALIYPINRARATPLDAFTVVDVVRATLGVGPCEYILDVEGQKSEYRGRATCANRDLIEGIYGRGEQQKRRAEVEESLKDVMVFIRHIRGRIESYVEYAHWAMDYLGRQKQAHPELAKPLSELETFARAVDERVADRREKIKTPDEAQKMVEEFRATVLDDQGPDALAKCKKFTRAWVDIGGNQDELVGECRWAVKVVRQRAGLVMAADPRLAEAAEEIRSRAQKVLRNPAGHEGARH